MAPSPIKSLPNYDMIRRMHQVRIKQFNDFFIEVHLTVTGLSELQQKISKMESSQTYPVPNMRGGRKNVRRKTVDVLNYLDKRISYSEYAQSLVFIIAIAEDYLSDIILAVLMAYPKKVLISAKGNEGDRTVSLREIIEKADVDRLIFEQAQSRLNEIMYASPAQYSSYFENVTGFTLGEPLPEYIEMKATRDLLIHNDGYINEIYIAKAGKLARGKLHEQITVDVDYFDRSVRLLKNISSNIYRGLLDKYGESSQFAEAVSKYLV